MVGFGFGSGFNNQQILSMGLGLTPISKPKTHHYFGCQWLSKTRP